MLRAMQNEAGRQLVRRLTDDLPSDLRDDPPTEGELAEGRARAVMLYESAAPVGAAVGAVAATVALAKVGGGQWLLGGAVGTLAAPLAVVAGVGVAVWGLARWIERA